ncbi:MAG: DUF4143 domain-containing protein, partial [Syntrophomonadaceae bacterium]|nr:DUF4143 domain-containing protein [Syntrophomonadaceae bacterium]
NLGSILENLIAQQLKAGGFTLYYYDAAKYGEVDFVVQNGMHIDLVEVKSGSHYKKHKALDNILGVGGWGFANAYVLCQDNVAVEAGVTYLPWYFVMFLHPAQVPKGLTYEIDLAGLET